MTDHVAQVTVPVGLLAEQERLGRARSVTRRVLARGRARRRVLPPLIAGSAALIGSSVIGSWLFGMAPPATTASPPPRPVPTTQPQIDQVRLAQDVTALNDLRQALAADQSAIAGLARIGEATAASGSVAATGARSTNGGASAAGSPGAGSSANTASGGISMPTASPTGPGVAALPPLPTIAPLPTLPTVTVPAAPPPPVHTTTGATVVVH
ncbi:MAG TPA: hypothetical protein VID75_13295 [Acidimicrobiales bacterium]|jgi:hypothetical protein